MKTKHTILGVHIDDRINEAMLVQELLTDNGNMIKTRIGLHEIAEGKAAKNGLILLEVVGPDAKIRELSDELNAIKGVEVQSMVFEHP